MIVETIPAIVIAYVVAAVVAGVVWYVYLEKLSEDPLWSKTLWSLIVATAWPLAALAVILLLLSLAMAWLGIDIYNDDGM